MSHCGPYRHQKTVSRQMGETIVDHVIEFLDWPGELLADAQKNLVVRKEAQALLLVVDSGMYDWVSGMFPTS